MRSFDERRAEIFRRGAEQRRRSRNLRRLAACGVPLLLCLAVYAATSLPHTEPEIVPPLKSDDSPSSSERTDFYVAADIQSLDGGEDDRRTIEDPATLEALRRALDALGGQPTTGTTNEPLDNLGSEDDKKDQSVRAHGYTLTLTAPDGEKIVYTLVGHQLTEEASQRAYTLTDAQLAEWQRMLGLNQ